jgi:nucleotide-binding universal stress UspA family protein
MFLNILAAVNGSPASRRALEHAIGVAQATNAMLTLVTVCPPLSPQLARVGISIEPLRAELDNWANRVLAEAAEAVPSDVIAHTVRRRGHIGREIERELHRGHYDLVVLGSRGHARTWRRLLGSVTGYLHVHSPVPLLSVPLPPHRDGHKP